jgi:hypothetical protein
MKHHFGNDVIEAPHVATRSTGDQMSSLHQAHINPNSAAYQ